MTLYQNSNLASIHISQLVDQLPANLRPYLQVVPPDWLIHDRAYYQQIAALPKLYREGRVVWAALVQANIKMFQLWPDHYTGEIVYDPTGQTDAATLLRCAQQIFALKGSLPSEYDQRSYLLNLEKERSGVFNTAFPQSLAALPLLTSSIWFWRPHLPDGMVTQRLFPVVVSDDAEFAGHVTVLPCLFWPAELHDSWLKSSFDLFAERYSEVDKLRQYEKSGRRIQHDGVAYPPLASIFDNEHKDDEAQHAFENPPYIAEDQENSSKGYLWILGTLLGLLLTWASQRDRPQIEIHCKENHGSVAVNAYEIDCNK